MKNYTSDLAKKLSFNIDSKGYCLNSPDNYQLVMAELNYISNIEQLDNNSTWIQAFYTKRDDLNRDYNKMKNRLSKNGQLWITWPKKSSVIKSDLSDEIVRVIGLSNGLVDNKIVSIDENWSALRFVYRLRDR